MKLEIYIETDNRDSAQQALSNLKRKIASVPRRAADQSWQLNDKGGAFVGLAKYEATS